MSQQLFGVLSHHCTAAVTLDGLQTMVSNGSQRQSVTSVLLQAVASAIYSAARCLGQDYAFYAQATPKAWQQQIPAQLLQQVGARVKGHAMLPPLVKLHPW